MSFIRKEPVDISRYLPAFVTKSREVKATLDAESREHERLRLSLIDVAKQFNVNTADWGLDLWEALYEIPTDRTTGSVYRRSVVLARMGLPPTVTELFMKHLVNHYVADQSAVVEDHPSDYSIDILYPGGQVLDYPALHEAIKTYIPAHLGYKLVTHTVGNMVVYGSGIVQIFRTNVVDMSTSVSYTVDDTRLHVAGAVVHDFRDIYVEGRP